MSKIKKITVSNLKAVASLTADFNGCTAIVTGGNNKGKTTFLKALADRIRGIKPSVILKHGEKEGFTEWELTSGEKFRWSFDAKKEKVVFISEKNIPQSLSKELAKYYFPPIFDVDEFLNATPAKQKKTLQELTGIDFTEIDRLYKEEYEARTYANKRVAEEKIKYDAMPMVDASLPDVPLPTDEIEKELAGIEAHNLRYDMAIKNIIAREDVREQNKVEIEDLMKKIMALEDKNEAINKEIKEIRVWADQKENAPKENQEELQAKIDEIKKQNLVILENNKVVEQEKVLYKAEQNAKFHDSEVKRIEAEKLDVIKNASMPEGFGFDDEGITYNGLPFNKESLSSSAIYIAALKLAALNLGEVKTLHFDASFLTRKSLEEVEAWANENDLQLLIERPDFEDGEIEYHLTNEA